jgi:hypothetical protein
MNGYTFDKNGVMQIADTVRRMRGQYANPKMDSPGEAQYLSPAVQPVRCTSTSATSSRYPGKLLVYDSDAKTYSDGDTIWIVDVNDGPPMDEQRFMGRFCGAVSGVAVYSVQIDGILKGKLDGDLSYNSTATMSVWDRTGGTETDTTVNITVRDWLLSSGQSVASGLQVIAVQIGSAWYVVGAQCA